MKSLRRRIFPICCLAASLVIVFSSNGKLVAQGAPPKQGTV
jgi:hypothetical protein